MFQKSAIQCSFKLANDQIQLHSAEVRSARLGPRAQREGDSTEASIVSKLPLCTLYTGGNTLRLGLSKRVTISFRTLRLVSDLESTLIVAVCVFARV